MTDTTVNKKTPRKTSYKLPVITVLLAITVLLVAAFALKLDRDYWITTCIATTITVFIVFLLWFCFGYLNSRKKGLIVLLAVTLPIIVFTLTFRPVLDGDLGFLEFVSRWTPKPDTLLDSSVVTNAAIDWQTTEDDFPWYLGKNSNGHIDNIKLDTDWKSNPPKEVWRIKVGAGWSGFVVVGDYAITHEQRGKFEMVVCRSMEDGKIVWTHQDEIRFDPLNPFNGLGEAGPRATPAVYNGRVFSHGATGIVNCLDAKNGKKIWSHYTIEENDAEIITWGKSGSPLIVGNAVVIGVGGPNGKSLIAYDQVTGKEAWSSGDLQTSYATPTLTTIAGVEQIVNVVEDFVIGHKADDGTILWEHKWPGKSNADPCNTNPLPVGKDRIVLSKAYGGGSELIQISKDDSGKFEAVILKKSSRTMKTKQTNPILYNGHLYGLDGGIFECAEVSSLKVKWKKRGKRIGHGQVLLVGDVLLVTTETSGEVVLVAAETKRYRELARFKVLTSTKKMWNYPTLSGKYLLVRNAEEAACFELPLLEEAKPAPAK